MLQELMEDFLHREDNSGAARSVAKWPHRECDLVPSDKEIYSAPFDRTSIEVSMLVRALGVQRAKGTARSNKTQGSWLCPEIYGLG